ncbi:hypothetical protein ACI6PS_02645 [Flavobacterium sp. PLA-1-15]|uniref:hypothetical protein n=1 Tax=Flavobacterium sp. PLA-1-15 TaxID=3380533 RepID=UPI003B7ABB3A
MKKLIGSNFELDLTPYKITDTEENSWFSDSFTSKVTYPFDIDMTDELDIAFGFLSSDNTSPETLYKAMYYENDRIHDAEFEILEIEGKRLQCSFEYGLEEFPSWNKKLSELPLHKFDLVGKDIYEFAKEMIDKTYPEVDFCFPAIHTDQFSKDDDLWSEFQEMINCYRNGEFVRNDFDSEEILSYNRNIMQPVPFFLYLIKAGLGSYVLEGDVLTDEKLLNNAAYAPVEYFRKRVPPELSIFMMGDEYISSPPEGPSWGFYQAIINVDRWGKYVLQGSVQRILPSSFLGNVKVSFNGVVIYDNDTTDEYVALEVFFETTNSDVNILTITTVSQIDIENIIFSLEVMMLDEYDEFGQSIPVIQNEDKIDLTRAVPDMTFGEYFTMVCNWRNYDYYIDGNRVIMNRIQNQMDFDNMISLEKYEVKTPLRKAQQGMSFLLKFQDLESNTYNYKYDSVFHSKSGYVYSDYVENKKTNTIEVNALPLPLLNRNGIETAHSFEYNTSKVYAVVYPGLTNGKNKTLDPVEILMPAIHLTNWFIWFNFRINSQAYKWSFKAFSADILSLTVKSKIYAYKNLHYIKSLIRTQIEPDIYEVEIETESFK